MKRFKVFLAAIFVLLPYSISAQEAVDLGLSVKWSTMNVGANSPEDRGDCFYWGDTSPYYKDKDYFDSSFKIIAHNKEFPWIPQDISSSKYDVARQKWGGRWRMPTANEYRELLTNCKVESVDGNSHKLWRVIGPNGKSILMPSEFYWSSSLDEQHNSHAYCMRLSDRWMDDHHHTISPMLRVEFGVIRPVQDYAKESSTRSDIRLAEQREKEKRDSEVVLQKKQMLIPMSIVLDIYKHKDDRNYITKKLSEYGYSFFTQYEDGEFWTKDVSLKEMKDKDGYSYYEAAERKGSSALIRDYTLGISVYGLKDFIEWEKQLQELGYKYVKYDWFSPDENGWTELGNYGNLCKKYIDSKGNSVEFMKSGDGHPGYDIYTVEFAQ